MSGSPDATPRANGGSPEYVGDGTGSTRGIVVVVEDCATPDEVVEVPTDDLVVEVPTDDELAGPASSEDDVQPAIAAPSPAARRVLREIVTM